MIKMGDFFKVDLPTNNNVLSYRMSYVSRSDACPGRFFRPLEYISTICTKCGGLSFGM